MSRHTERESFLFHMMTKPSFASILTEETILRIEIPPWLNGIVTLKVIKKKKSQ